MDRRSFLHSSVAAGALGMSAGCRLEPTPGQEAEGAAAVPGERDWAAMGRVDQKPIQPIDEHVLAVGRDTMVSTDHPYATEAALWALERGGSAADAYITAALVQCVLEPTMTTLGGGFGVTFFDAGESQLSMAGGAFAWPSGAPATEPYDESRSWTAWGAMVPGYVRGVEVAHEAFGRLPWSDLWEPAIALAENGFVVDHMLWGYLHHSRKMVGRFEGPGRSNWFRGDYLVGVGDMVALPELAGTLRSLQSEGGDYFYEGPFARKLVDEVQRRGGGITLGDLRNFDQAFAAPLWRPGDPGSVQYRGYDVAPSSGALFQLGLQVYEVADLAAMGRPTENTESLHAQIRLAQELWYRGQEISPETFAEFISEDHAREVWQAIQSEPSRPFEGFSAATCGVVVVDSDGNVAGGTHSSSSEPFGTGVNVDGVVLNRATYLRKYTQIPQGFSTQLWLFRGGAPALVMATPSRSLMECLLQGAANAVEFDMDGVDVVSAPRFGHPHPGLVDIEIEGDFGDEALSSLEARGHRLFPVSPKDANMGSIHGLRIGDDGTLEGLADPRRRGMAKGS